MSEKINVLKKIYFVHVFSISTITANKLSIQDNLGNFQIPGDLGPLTWGYLSPFLSEEQYSTTMFESIIEQCFSQYKEGIRIHILEYAP